MKSGSNKSKARRGSRNRVRILDLSDSELAMMRAELEDESGLRRNAAMLAQLMRTNHDLRPLLFDPMPLTGYLARLVQDLRANRALSGEAVSDEEVQRHVAQRYQRVFNPQSVLNRLTFVAKNTKIKREKRALLWAIGGVFHLISQNEQPVNTPIYNLIVQLSMQRAMGAQKMAEDLAEGREPHNFSHENYLKEGGYDDFIDLIGKLGLPGFDAFSLLDAWFLGILSEMKQAAGFRFHQILHYPAAAPKRKSTLITGAAEQPDETPESEEATQKIIEEGFVRDYRLMLPDEFAREYVRSFKSAKFGELPADRLNVEANIAALVLLNGGYDTASLHEIYIQSGKNALELNPEDEKNDIIEILSSPENPRAYQNYGERLCAKDEWGGAFRAYVRTVDLMGQAGEEPGEEIRKRTHEIWHKVYGGNEDEPQGEESAEDEPPS